MRGQILTGFVLIHSLVVVVVVVVVVLVCRMLLWLFFTVLLGQVSSIALAGKDGSHCLM